MTTRPPVPMPPDVLDPTLAAALTKGTGTRALGDRRRWWGTLCVAGALCFAVPWVAWHLIAVGASWADVLWWACLAELAGLVGVVWIGLTLAQDVAQLVFMLRLWRGQLADLGANASARRDALIHFGHKHWGAPSPKAPVPILVSGVDVETVRARKVQAAFAEAARANAKADSMAADVQRLLGQFAAWDTRQSARVAETTAHLPTHGPRVAAYEGGAGRTLIDRLHAGLPIGVNALCERHNDIVIMDKPTRKAAVDLLVGAGVLVDRGSTYPLVLVPDLAAALTGQSLAVWHKAVIRRLEGSNGND